MRIGETRVDDGDRVAVDPAMIGFDEPTVMLARQSRRLRRRRFVTAAVDVTTGQIGLSRCSKAGDAKHLQTQWMVDGHQDPGWLAKILRSCRSIRIEGYRSAIGAEGSPLA